MRHRRVGCVDFSVDSLNFLSRQRSDGGAGNVGPSWRWRPRYRRGIDDFLLRRWTNFTRVAIFSEDFIPYDFGAHCVAIISKSRRERRGLAFGAVLGRLVLVIVILAFLCGLLASSSR